MKMKLLKKEMALHFFKGETSFKCHSPDLKLLKILKEKHNQKKLSIGSTQVRFKLLADRVSLHAAAQINPKRFQRILFLTGDASENLLISTKQLLNASQVSDQIALVSLKSITGQDLGRCLFPLKLRDVRIVLVQGQDALDVLKSDQMLWERFSRYFKQTPTSLSFSRKLEQSQ
jgi:hypothetical protein